VPTKLLEGAGESTELLPQNREQPTVSDEVRPSSVKMPPRRVRRVADGNCAVVLPRIDLLLQHATERSARWKPEGNYSPCFSGADSGLPLVPSVFTQQDDEFAMTSMFG
jgi:hypothetical protein